MQVLGDEGALGDRVGECEGDLGMWTTKVRGTFGASLIATARRGFKDTKNLASGLEGGRAADRTGLT